MPESHKCPFCNNSFFLDTTTFFKSEIAFDLGRQLSNGCYCAVCDTDYSAVAHLFRCPNCQKISTIIKFTGGKLPKKTIPLYPNSLARQFPQYVPENIRQDYEEAYAILYLSPKASATLARRCLQGMIRDFWDIHKNNLNEAISALEDKVLPTQWRAINAVRRLGNIGAHMEHDVNKIIDIDPGEAEKLIKLIELLIEDWYIRRHEQEKLYDDIIAIDETKQNQRKS